MIDRLIDKAVNYSFASDWQNAIKMYEQILDQDPSNMTAKLGLAFCMMQIQNYDEAESLYTQILDIFPTNNIANNNLNKIKLLKKQKTGPSSNSPIIPDVTFVHIPGKTKIVLAVMLGQLNVLLKLNVGQKLDLHLKKRRVELRNTENEYVAALPDDLSRRLFTLIETGNIYETWIKSVTKSSLEIFIQEVFQSPQNSEIISFPKSITPPIALDENNKKSEKGEDEDEKSINEKDIDVSKVSQEDSELELESDDDEEEPEMLDQLAEKITEEEVSEFSSNYDDLDPDSVEE